MASKGRRPATPRKPVPAEMRVPTARIPLDLSRENIVALQTETLRHSINGTFQKALAEFLSTYSPAQPASIETSRAFNRLAGPDAGFILPMIWKESEFVKAQELDAAGVARTFKGTQLTCHGLGRNLKLADVLRAEFTSLYCATPTLRMYVQRARRVIDAAQHFGLVAYAPGNENPQTRPIIATPALAELMRFVALRCAAVLHDGWRTDGDPDTAI